MPAARRGGAPVGVRQQQVKRGRAELQQRLVGGNRVVRDVDRAQNAAVAATELWRLEAAEAISDRVEAAAAVGVAPVSSGRLRVAVKADADSDAQALEHGQHRTVEEGAVGLHGHVHLGGDAGTERPYQGSQPFRPREQRLTAVQDDFDGGEIMPLRVLRYALDGLVNHHLAHSLRQVPPALICHLIDIAVGARQIAATVDLENELPEGNRPVSCRANRCDVKLEQGPSRRVFPKPGRRHSNQAANSSGSARIP